MFICVNLVDRLCLLYPKYKFHAPHALRWVFSMGSKMTTIDRCYHYLYTSFMYYHPYHTLPGNVRLHILQYKMDILQFLKAIYCLYIFILCLNCFDKQPSYVCWWRIFWLFIWFIFWMFMFWNSIVVPKWMNRIYLTMDRNHRHTPLLFFILFFVLDRVFFFGLGTFCYHELIKSQLMCISCTLWL